MKSRGKQIRLEKERINSRVERPQCVLEAWHGIETNSTKLAGISTWPLLVFFPAEGGRGGRKRGKEKKQRQAWREGRGGQIAHARKSNSRINWHIQCAESVNFIHRARREACAIAAPMQSISWGWPQTVSRKRNYSSDFTFRRVSLCVPKGKHAQWSHD